MLMITLIEKISNPISSKMLKLLLFKSRHLKHPKQGWTNICVGMTRRNTYITKNKHTSW